MIRYPYSLEPMPSRWALAEPSSRVPAARVEAKGVLAQGIDCKSTMEFGNTEALKQAAIHGAGIAWLPRISMSGDVADSLLHELPAPRFRVLRPLKILLRDRAYLEPQMQTFLKLIHPSLLTRLV